MFLLQALSKYVPSKNISSKYSFPWINGHVKKMILKRRKLYTSLTKNNVRPRENEIYTRFNKLVNSQVEEAYWNHVNNLFDSQATDKENKKNLFKFIKSKKKDQHGIPTLKHHGELISDSKPKANLLNEYFSSMFTSSDQAIPDKGISPYPSMSDINITANGVNKLLSDLRTNKAHGPDGIPAKLLKTVANELSPALVSLFQQSLNTGIFPKELKKANIAPIHKKGSKSSVENYRPISLTCILSKCFEHIIASQLMNHLEKNDILSPKQHGFRKNKSTVSQLLLTSDDFAKTLNFRSQTDSILLDFSKAFDRVSHKHLLYKLDFYGIRGNYLKWTKSFLGDRYQRVVVDGKASAFTKVLSGVPQGTVLGPLFFLCFINDLPDRVTSQIRLFADDAILYRQIDSPSDQQDLQNDLNILVDWSKAWLMDFNPQKCVTITITHKKKPCVFDYTINGQTLQNVKSHPYLGVHLDSKLTWTTHIDLMVGKATRSLNFLSRNLYNCPPHVKETAYNIYIRPQLEYASPVWSPQYSSHISKLEKVHARAARFVSGRYSRTDSLTNILQSLCWSSLQNRRDIIDITYCHKILHNYLHVPTQQTFIPHNSNTRSNKQPFQNLYGHTDAYTHSYFPRTIRKWNKLPPDITQIENPDAFKKVVTKMLQQCY